MASVGESQVVGNTPVWYLLILEPWSVRPIITTWCCYNSSCQTVRQSWCEFIFHHDNERTHGTLQEINILHDFNHILQAGLKLKWKKMKMKCSLSNAYTRRTVTRGVTIPQEWHGVHTVLPATHTIIHEWNEPSCIHLGSIHQMLH